MLASRLLCCYRRAPRGGITGFQLTCMAKKESLKESHPSGAPRRGRPIVIIIIIIIIMGNKQNNNNILYVNWTQEIFRSTTRCPPNSFLTAFKGITQRNSKAKEDGRVIVSYSNYFISCRKYLDRFIRREPETALLSNESFFLTTTKRC